MLLAASGLGAAFAGFGAADALLGAAGFRASVFAGLGVLFAAGAVGSAEALLGSADAFLGATRHFASVGANALSDSLLGNFGGSFLSYGFFDDSCHLEVCFLKINYNFQTEVSIIFLTAEFSRIQ